MSEIASRSRSDILLRTKLEPTTPIQEDDPKLITGILADLAENCTEAFSRPPANYAETADAASNSRLEDNRGFPHSGESASMLAQSNPEVVDLERQARPRSKKTQAEERDHGLGTMESYQISRHTSLSRPSTIRGGVADSATSLVKKDKNAIVETYLREGESLELSLIHI